MRAEVLLRLIRFQFLPVILSPILAGTGLAWWTNRIFNPFLFVLVILGSTMLHLGANAIDDAYDYQSGVDETSNRMFPPDFGGWKPLPRGMITLHRAKEFAYGFFLGALVIGVYLTLVAGPLVFVLGAIGAFFGFFHVAPPLRLGYHGLGEAGVAISFGILPALGAFLVQTDTISYASILVGLPLGLLTATILMNHDQIFYEPYRQSGKRSLTVILGRKTSMETALLLTIISYATILLAVSVGLLPATSLLVVLSIPLLLRQAWLYRAKEQSPPVFVKLTVTTFLISIFFGLLLTIAFIVS